MWGALTISWVSQLLPSVYKRLHKLTRKTASGFQWNEICQQAFELLKEHLVSPPILAYPQFDRPFILYTDASEGAIGAVLSQMEDGRERVIAYWSRQLTKAERNYSTIEREALAIVAAAKEFYPYLYGFHFKVVTDHNPLTSQRELRDVGGRLTRWRLFLQQLDYEVEYRAGVKNGNADALSRRPDNKTEAVVATLQSLWSFGDLDEIRREQENDPYLSTVMEAVCSGTPPPGLTRQQKRLSLQQGVLCRTFRESASSSPITQILVPCKLRPRILEELHDKAGHFGV